MFLSSVPLPHFDARHFILCLLFEMPTSGPLMHTPRPVSTIKPDLSPIHDVEKEPDVHEEPVLADSLTSGSAADTETERKLLWKIDYHVVPPLTLLFLLAFLDRVNIGNANIQGLSTELHLEKHQYNIALLVFFIP